MAVTQRIAEITLTDALSNSRTFRATATVLDTAAGSSVDVAVMNFSGGTVPPGIPDTYTLAFHDDAGTLIRSASLATGNGVSQTVTFFFTATGLTGGASRCGTVEMKLRVTKTTGGPTATYDVESDGAPNTPPTLFTATVLHRGWIRGSTSLIESVSNISLGGGKNSPAQYDETLYVRTTCGAVSYVARAFTVAIGSTTPALSAATNSTTAATRDVTFTNVCDERFPAAATVSTVTVTIPNATLTGLPAIAISSTTDDTITVDPRLTCEHLLQIDNNVSSTPPLSNPQASGQRVFPQNGYLLTNIRAARGTRVGDVITGGVNGLTFDITLIASATGQNFGGTAFTTVLRGGEDGWQNTMLIWTAVVGGIWTKTVTVTTADIDTAGYLINPTVTYSLVAINPDLILICGSTGFGDQQDHFLPGVDPFFVGLTLLDGSTGMTQTLDETPTVFIMRFNFTALALEYLGLDLAWHALGAGTADAHVLGATPDPNVFASVYPPDPSWTADDLFVTGRAIFAGSPYQTGTIQLVVGQNHRHSQVEVPPEIPDQFGGYGI